LRESLFDNAFPGRLVIDNSWSIPAKAELLPRQERYESVPREME